MISGEVIGSDTADPVLIDEFTGFGERAGARNTATTAAPLTTQATPSAVASTATGLMPSPAPPGPAASMHADAAGRQSGRGTEFDRRIPYMTAQRPTHAQLKEIVGELGMHMSDARIQEFLDVMQGTLDAYDVVDAMPDHLPPVLYPRTAGHRPSPEENPLNAWYVRTEVRGAPRGPLHGRTVALKDNVCLAGVP